MSQSVDMADSLEALQSENIGLLAEMERLEKIIGQLVWMPNGKCIHCHAAKPDHLPRCYVNSVLFEKKGE